MHTFLKPLAGTSADFISLCKQGTSFSLPPNLNVEANCYELEILKLTEDLPAKRKRVIIIS